MQVDRSLLPAKGARDKAGLISPPVGALTLPRFGFLSWYIIPPDNSCCLPRGADVPLLRSYIKVNMNWTGGKLQRHSKVGRNEVLQRQKQHFAKVRQQLQNGTSSSVVPFPPNWLAHDQASLAEGVIPLGQGSQRPVGHYEGQQKTLEEFKMTAPVAHRLASMSRKRPPRYVGAGAGDNDIHLRRKFDSSGISLLVVDSNRTSGSKGRVQAMSQSSSLSTRRKRLKPHPTPGDALELSRKRLLQQTDWVGLAATRPLHMTFSSRRDKNQIGKRRKIGSDSTRRHLLSSHAVQHSLASPVGYLHDEEIPFMHGALQTAPGSISIRIGNDVVPSQMATTAEHLMDHPVEALFNRQSSDTMLFDEEQAQFAHRNESTSSSAELLTTASGRPEEHGQAQPHGRSDSNYHSIRTRGQRI
jgi:hypothetical protein